MINIFKLNTVRDRTLQTKLEIYNKVLKKIHTKIKFNSKKGVAQAIYIIPKFVLGLPTYNQINCAIFCVNKLKFNGFIVIYTYPNLVFISWEHVPSIISNPDVAPVAHKIKSNPEKDYSSIIYKISNIYPNNQVIDNTQTNHNNPRLLKNY